MDLSLLYKILAAAPAQVVPFLLTLAVISYLSFKIYQEFRKVYQKINAEKAALGDRVTKLETSLAKCDERTLMLSVKLEKIENNLERINTTLVEVGTTLRLMREDREQPARK
jgi:predicted nuclease with TOPRIM domain